MTSRPPPKPEEDRASATERLMREKGSDSARWARPDSLAGEWDARAALAACWIMPGARVLDVGAGAMALERFLKPGCTYQPADLVERRPGCIVMDLNRGEFPDGEYDVVTMLGVLEYVHDVDAALARALAAAPRLVVTYCSAIAGAELRARRCAGWVNDLEQSQFEQALARAGWRIDRSVEVKRGPGNVQWMFGCSRRT